MTILMRLVPAWLVLAVFAMLGAVILGQQVQVSNARARSVRAEANIANLQARYAESARAAEAAARTEEQRRADAVRKVVNDAQTQTAAARADAVRAAGAADGLRSRVAALVAASRRGAGNPPPAGGSQDQQGDDPIGVLAKLSSGADTLAGIYAETADRRRVVAEACERIGDGLQPDGQ